MTGNAQTEHNNSNALNENGFPDLRQIYRSWEFAMARADDPRLGGVESQKAISIVSDCEKLACGITAMTMDDLAVKAVIALGGDERGLCAPDLGQSLVLDARRILAIPERDQEIAGYFDIWAELLKAREDVEIEDPANDRLMAVTDEVEAKVARLVPSTAEGLARKIIMTLDLGSIQRSIVQSTRADIERLAGHSLVDI